MGRQRSGTLGPQRSAGVGGVGGEGLQRDPFGTDHVIIDDSRAVKGYLED